jgi:hypothetical protein
MILSSVIILIDTIIMAKRRGAISSKATKEGKHPPKTKKRLAAKAEMLAAKAAKAKPNTDGQKYGRGKKKKKK